MSNFTQLIETDAQPAAMGRDVNGLFFDMRWITVESKKIATSGIVRNTATRQRREGRVYCTPSEMKAYYQELLASGWEFVGEMPSFANIFSCEWGVTISHPELENSDDYSKTGGV